MTTAAVLSVQQLSEVADSIPRYRLLAQLGCDRAMVLRSLRTQIGIYFVAPLLVAGCHFRMHDQPSVCGFLLSAWGASGGYRYACHRHRAGGCGVRDLSSINVPGCAFGSRFRCRQEAACIGRRASSKARKDIARTLESKPLPAAEPPAPLLRPNSLARPVPFLRMEPPGPKWTCSVEPEEQRGRSGRFRASVLYRL